jgi:hypothetical protein
MDPEVFFQSKALATLDGLVRNCVNFLVAMVMLIDSPVFLGQYNDIKAFTNLKCFDCGRAYSSDGLDCFVSIM